MLSAICFNLDQSKSLSSSNGLKGKSITTILYHKILTLLVLKKKTFENTVRKGGNGVNQHFLLLYQLFLLYQRGFHQC